MKNKMTASTLGLGTLALLAALATGSKAAAVGKPGKLEASFKKVLDDPLETPMTSLSPDGKKQETKEEMAVIVKKKLAALDEMDACPDNDESYRAVETKTYEYDDVKGKLGAQVSNSKYKVKVDWKKSKFDSKCIKDAKVTIEKKDEADRDEGIRMLKAQVLKLELALDNQGEKVKADIAIGKEDKFAKVTIDGKGEALATSAPEDQK